MENHQLEGHVTSTEAERDGTRFVPKKEQAVLFNVEETLLILKTENHQLEGRVTSAETERDGALRAEEGESGPV